MNLATQDHAPILAIMEYGDHSLLIIVLLLLLITHVPQRPKVIVNYLKRIIMSGEQGLVLPATQDHAPIRVITEHGDHSLLILVLLVLLITHVPHRPKVIAVYPVQIIMALLEVAVLVIQEVALTDVITALGVMYLIAVHPRMTIVLRPK